MAIQQTTAPAAAKSQLADKAEKPKEAKDGQVSAPAFSKLLKGAQSEGGDLAQALQVGNMSALAGMDTDTLPLSDATYVPGLELLQGAWSLDSLVGQTQRLDVSDADAALQDGSFLQARQDAGLAGVLTNNLMWGAQPNVALGQSVATVAAGVQSALNAPVEADAKTAMAAASALLAQATDVAESVAQAVEGLKTDQASEGRVALQGAWKLEDPQAMANPALHRVMGQIEQWAAASAGVQPKATERVEGKSAGAAAEWLSAGQGSGTRLTENSVQETQQTQDAAFEAQADAPVEDMRFWLQGKQQRAEVVLDKDGQAVRVQVSVRGNEAHVTFRADQAQTREMLDASVAQLREMLEQQGVQLAGVSVQADDRGQQQSSDQQASSGPWQGGPAQHAQVAVPVAEVASTRPQRAQGLDLYA